jgi:type II secretory pathway pseudopilin PulG
MTRTLNAQRGLSLVEVTIMLLVLMLLTSVLAPSIFDFVNDARRVKVKEDCEAIGVSVARLTRDVGSCLKFRADQPCTMQNRVDLLYSGGPKVTDADVDPGVVPLLYGNAKGTLTWKDEEERGDSMEHQMVDNGAGGAPAYPTPGMLGNYNRTLPEFGLGWRGAYVSGPIGADPWGHRYLVNTVFLSVARDMSSRSSNIHPVAQDGWSEDVFCISAGPNGVFQSDFAGTVGHGTNRKGDDFTFVIQGDTR